MSDTQVSALDHTVQLTNGWLKWLAEDGGLRDRPHAYSALRAVLHALRDRMTPEQAVHLGAQLPLLVRGVYYEGWRIAGKPGVERHLEDFLTKIAAELAPSLSVDPDTVARAVFALLWRELDPGEAAKVVDNLPMPLRVLWPEAAQSFGE
jgi:uncharacterized protein (DUF2267 family)